MTELSKSSRQIQTNLSWTSNFPTDYDGTAYAYDLYYCVNALNLPDFLYATNLCIISNWTVCGGKGNYQGTLFNNHQVITYEGANQTYTMNLSTFNEMDWPVTPSARYKTHWLLADHQRLDS